MKFTMFISSAVVCGFFMVFGVLAGPTQISAGEKAFSNDLNHPSVHVTLLSIEDRLRNLEDTLSVQCATAINGKMDYYGRKIDNIEKDLSRFQVYMRMELDKISENISSKNFKDDITKDRIIRKIDAIYERINHKLGNIEGQIDISNVKFQNAREMLMSKLEKMEESLTIRDADMEAELADAVAAIDDLKTTCTTMEENIVNVTKESTKTFFKSTEKSIKKQYSQTINLLENTNKSLSLGLVNLQETVHFLVNRTNSSSNEVKRAKDELDENLNEYANKITDMYSDLWIKTETLDNTVQNLAKVANLTRSEQQNGLRALMVQVGRKSSKPGVQSDSSIDNQKIAELSQKIDTNFENVMLAQNLFLESCHRVQMDESQLESQISVVLDRLIDIFENKTSVGPKDIEQLENLIRTHDSNIRRSIYHVTNNLLGLMQKTTNGNDEIIEYINNQRVQLEALFTLLQDVLNSSTDFERTQTILEALQDFQQQLNETHHQTHMTLTQINLTNSFIVKLLNTSNNNSQINSAKLQQTLEFIKNIYHILTSIEMKINKSYLDYYFNKYNIDAIAHRFGKKLNEYIQSTEPNGTKLENITKTKTNTEEELLLEIFGENPNKEQVVDPYDDYPYTIESNALQTSNMSGEHIENIVLLCSSDNTNINCDKINNTKYILVKQNETETNNIPANTSEISNNCLPTYIDLIDVRSNSETNNTTNCNLINITTDVTLSSDYSSNITKDLEKSKHTSNNCLPNYIELIDVRSNYGTNATSNCTFINGNSTNTTNSDDENVESYDIDVRYGVFNETLNKNETNLNNTKNTNNEEEELSQEENSTKQDIITKKWVTTLPSTEVPEISSTLHEILNETEDITTQENSMSGNWLEAQPTEMDGVVISTQENSQTTVITADENNVNEEKTITEENPEINPFQDDRTTLTSHRQDNVQEYYATSSMEDDSTEMNEFEYTNHEYH